MTDWFCFVCSCCVAK